MGSSARPRANTGVPDSYSGPDGGDLAYMPSRSEYVPPGAAAGGDPLTLAFTGGAPTTAKPLTKAQKKNSDAYSYAPPGQDRGPALPQKGTWSVPVMRQELARTMLPPIRYGRGPGSATGGHSFANGGPSGGLY